MSTVLLKWTVSTRATLIAGDYILQKVECDDGGGGGFAEITQPTNRMPLVANVADYLFHHAGGSVSYTYRVTFAKADGTLEGSPQTITDKTLQEYVTVAEIRAEGYTLADYPDATDAFVQAAIEMATKYVHRETGQWFYPAYRYYRFSGRNKEQTFFQVPVCAIMMVKIDGDEMDLTDGVRVFNRHLTQNMLDPDDRFNPGIAFEPALYLTDDAGYERQIYSLERFNRGVHNIEVWGIFGCTELDIAEQTGETALDSQVPLSYGDIPVLIKNAIKRLVIRHMFPLGSDDAAEQDEEGRVLKRKTRDQSIEYAATRGGATGSMLGAESFSGDATVDQILARYSAPLSLGSV